MRRQRVYTEHAPQPMGAYSQAVRFGDLVQVAGQGPIDPGTGRLVDDGIEEQARQALENVQRILVAADTSFAQVVMARVYLTDPAHFAAMDRVYRTFVSEPHPARTTVFVDLPDGMLVEIDALAVAPVARNDQRGQ